MSPQNAPRTSLTSTQAIIDGSTTGVPRLSYPYKHLTLTPLKLSALPRGDGTKHVRKEVYKEAIVDEWDKSSWALKRVTVQKRWALTDFGRCSVILACLPASRES
jgi:large subunit ribosomal protein L14e